MAAKYKCFLYRQQSSCRSQVKIKNDTAACYDSSYLMISTGQLLQHSFILLSTAENVGTFYDLCNIFLHEYFGADTFTQCT
jgi:hypothetical protein